jgi:hypothetical protein
MERFTVHRTWKYSNRLGYNCASFDVKNHVHNFSFVKNMGKLFLEMKEDVSILGVVSGHMMAGGSGA